MSGKPRRRILAVMLEFADWREAKPWSYLASYALLDGFEACGAEWTVLPSVVIYGDRGLNPWLDARESLIPEGERFDQVWVWLTHAHFPEGFWPWLERIAPVRVGVLMESLRYTPEELASWEGYGWRFDAAVAQGRHLTHMVSYDEHDVGELGATTPLHTHLLQNMIPARLVRDVLAPTSGKALFLGTLYDKRQAFLQKAALGDRVEMMATPEADSGLQARFDALNQAALTDLASGRMTPEVMRAFVLELKALRLTVLEGVMDAYRSGIAVLALPAYFKGFTGRVVEALAAGVPMVNNRLEGRPLTNGLLRDGQDILLYDQDDPADLGRKIDALYADATLRETLASNGRARLLERLTSELQMALLQDWIARTSGSRAQRLAHRIRMRFGRLLVGGGGQP